MKTVFGFKNFIGILSEYIFGVLFFSAMVWAICFDIFYGETVHETTLAHRQLSLVIFLVATSIVYFYFRLRFYKKNQIWQLKNDFLIRGTPASLEVYIPSVEFVIKGLPEPLPGFQKLHYNLMTFKFGTNNPLRHQYENSLILKLGPSTYLPLYLYHYGNGDKLMTEISSCLVSKVLAEKKFTYIERRLLTPWKCNKLVNI